MVLKRSKHNFNSGNTIRKRRKCWNRQLITRIWNQKHFVQDRALYENCICLNNLLQNDEYLNCDVPASLNKARNWEIWERVKGDLLTYLDHQASVKETSVCVSIKEENGITKPKLWGSHQQLSEDRLNSLNRNKPDDNITFLKAHRSLYRGIQRKLSLDRSRSKIKADIKREEELLRATSIEADLFYHVQDIEERNYTSQAARLGLESEKTRKAYKKSKGIKNKQKNNLLCVDKYELQGFTCLDNVIRAQTRLKGFEKIYTNQHTKVSNNYEVTSLKKSLDQCAENQHLKKKVIEPSQNKKHSHENTKQKSRTVSDIELWQNLFGFEETTGNDLDKVKTVKNVEFIKVLRTKDISEQQVLLIKKTKQCSGSRTDSNISNVPLIKEPRTAKISPKIDSKGQKDQKNKWKKQEISCHGPDSISNTEHEVTKSDTGLEKNFDLHVWKKHCIDIVKPILVKVKCASLKPCFLLKKFGGRYLEGGCTPRCFSVNLPCDLNTKDDKVTEQGHAWFRDDLQAMLVFQAIPHCTDNRRSDSGPIPHQHMLVYPKGFLNTQGELALREGLSARLHQHMLYPTTKVLETFAKLYRELPPQQYLHRLTTKWNMPGMQTASHIHQDWIQDLFPWQYEVRSLREAIDIVKDTGHHQFNQKLPPITPRCTGQSLCGSCGAVATSLNSLRKPLESYAADVKASQRQLTGSVVTLTACQHSFCRACIKMHLDKGYKKKTDQILCLSPGCPAVLDEVIIQWCMSLPMYVCHRDHVGQSQLQQHPLWSMCPSQQCQRAAKLTGTSVLDGSVMITCPCGHTWCFQCGGQGHWPASCKQYATYTKWNRPAADFKRPH